MDALKNEKIGKLIFQYSVPNIIVTVSFALYLLTLQFFIVYGTDLGDRAISGIGICFPVIMLISAFGSLTGAGASSRISILLGEGKKDTAHDVLGNAIMLSVVISSVFLLIFFLFFDFILSLMGVTAEIYSYAKDFLTIYTPCAIPLVLSTCLTSVMRATGHPGKSMLIVSFNLIFSLVLIAFFLYVLKLGLKGAALAISIGSTVGLIPILIHFLKKGCDLPIRIRSLKLKPHIVWLIFNIGFSPFLISFSAALLASVVINRLSAYGGDTAIAAYAIVNSLTSIIYMILTGLSQGIQPIVGYNYGIKRTDRVFKTVKIAGGSVIVVSLTGLVIVCPFARPLVELFSPSRILAEEAVFCMQIGSLGMPFAGLHMLIGSFFQSTGFAGKTFFLNIARQFVFTIPLAFIFPVFWGVEGIWYSLPLSELLTMLLCITMFFIHIKPNMKSNNY
jgi:putative MATE family efflux protein